MIAKIDALELILNKALDLINPETTPPVNNNGDHVGITFIICGAAVIVALIAMITLLLLKNKTVKSKKELLKQEEEAKTAELLSQQKFELIGKYLHLLKENQQYTYRYRITLEYLIELIQQDKMKDFTVEELEAYINRQIKDC